MKKTLCLILSIITVLTTLSIGVNAYAAELPAYYEQREQYNAQKANAGFYGEKLYFFENNEEKLYVKKGLKGTPRVVKSGIACNGHSSMYKKYVYYIGEDGILYKCSLDGKKFKSLVKNIYVTDFIIANGRLVYRAEDPFGDLGVEGLFTCTLNGKDTKKITGRLVSEYYSYKNCVYFIDVKSNKLKRYNFKKNKLEKIKLAKSISKMYLIGMEGRCMYFHRPYKTLDKFFKVDVKTGAFTKIAVSKDKDTVKKDVSYLVCRDKVYCVKVDAKKIRYCVLNNATSKFDALYTASTTTASSETCMQFFKDSVVDIKYQGDYPVFEFITVADTAK